MFFSLVQNERFQFLLTFPTNNNLKSIKILSWRKKLTTSPRRRALLIGIPTQRQPPTAVDVSVVGVATHQVVEGGLLGGGVKGAT